MKSENLTIEIIEKLFEANSEIAIKKLRILCLIDVKLKVLQILIRGIFDLKTISDKKYLLLSKNLLEIGRMLGGWIKSLKK